MTGVTLTHPRLVVQAPCQVEQIANLLVLNYGFRLLRCVPLDMTDVTLKHPRLVVQTPCQVEQIANLLVCNYGLRVLWCVPRYDRCHPHTS
jgi:hypothetical protein